MPPPAPSWPRALRAVRAWLSPWTVLQRWWAAWSKAPPPPQLQALINAVGAGSGLHLYLRAPAGVIIPSSIARWPGSVVDGQPYTITRDLPIAPLPRWITTHLTSSRRRTSDPHGRTTT